MVSWQFLEALLHNLGFEDGVVQRIMKCVKSISFTNKVNGDFTDPSFLIMGMQGSFTVHVPRICGEALKRCSESASKMGKILHPKGIFV